MIVLYLFLILTSTYREPISQSRLPRLNIQNEELLEMSRCLRNADINRANAGQISVNYQGTIDIESKVTVDNATEKFFTYVDMTIFNKLIYQQFFDLMDNFYRETGKAEPRVSVEEEQREVSAFLKTVLNSKPFALLYNFLSSKRHPYATDPFTFCKFINQLWFEHYRRSSKPGALDSSGFEHVFIGEKKKGKVSGLHNWARIFLLEANATEKFDYKGYIQNRGVTMAALKYSWDREMKDIGSFLIGTSPEFDLAVYTLCFLFRRGLNNTCQIEIDGIKIAITSFDIVRDGKVHVGTVFPDAITQ